MNTNRIKRAADKAGRISVLKELYPESAEVLTFLERIVDYQASVADKLDQVAKQICGLQEMHWEDHISVLEELLGICTAHGTEEIKIRANELKEIPAAGVRLLLLEFINGYVPDNTTRFILLCFMQPLAASLLAVTDSHDNIQKDRCPVCGFQPAVSFIRDTTEVAGGRYLRCLLCGTDWAYQRTTCVSCGTNADDSFDYFFDDKHSCIAIQACRKCSKYTKIVDTRKDGQAVPELEDIASISLDMWAQGRGLIKVSKNLIGI